MMAKIHELTLLFLLISMSAGAWSMEVHFLSGEIVELHCPHTQGHSDNNVTLVWTCHTTHRKYEINNMSTAELKQIGVLLHQRSLVILNATGNHEGTCSCSQGNSSSNFTLKVQSSMYEESSLYPQTCFTQESYKLNCPDTVTLNVTKKGFICRKESALINCYFQSVEEKDRGNYTCTRSYLYQGQVYNKTYRLYLDVKPKTLQWTGDIISPKNNEVIQADLGSEVVINCTAVSSSHFDNLFWLNKTRNSSLPVFYKTTQVKNGTEIKMTASLVFRKVSEKDLSENYTCKLQSSSQSPRNVTITLARNARYPYLHLILCVTGTLVSLIVMKFVLKKLIVDITLFLRDTLGCYCSGSDGKSYDAFVMCYKSDTDQGLNADDRKYLETLLEERFGYNLCLFDRDVLPGEDIAVAVLDCVKQSQTVVLVPTSPDLGLGSGLLSAIHEALVERQTRLIFIKTETMAESTSGSLPEALQLLSQAGDCVTWKGKDSSLSSSFWKLLRYHLPAPRCSPKIKFLPQVV